MAQTTWHRRLKKWVVALALGLALIGGSIGRNHADAANWSTRPAPQPTPTVVPRDVEVDDEFKVNANWSTRWAGEPSPDVTVSE